MLGPETPSSKRRKVEEKTVVKVRVGENLGNLKNEGLPSDNWAWRKYGQKPIKGSPYPRGYYRCSSSKGCPAKKQVERCRTDSCMLIVTYHSTHNHPSPNGDHNSNQIQQLEKPKGQLSETQDIKTQSKCQGEDQKLQDQCQQVSMKNMKSENTCSRNEKRKEALMGLILDEEPTTIVYCSTNPMKSSSDFVSEMENDFFNELEELPITSGFGGYMTGGCL